MRQTELEDSMLQSRSPFPSSPATLPIPVPLSRRLGRATLPALVVYCALALPPLSAAAQLAKPDKRASLPASSVRPIAAAISREPVVDFDDLQASDAGNDRRTVNADGAANAINAEVELHGARHNASVDRRRAAAAERSADLPAAPPRSGQSNSGAAPRAAGPTSFVCSYKCTNARMLGADKTTLRVTVSASRESEALDLTHKHAKDTCYQQTQRVYETGSASCRKQ